MRVRVGVRAAAAAAAAADGRVCGRRVTWFLSTGHVFKSVSLSVCLPACLPTLPAYCIPKVVRMKTGEVLYEKVYMSPRPPPKISLKHEWKRELGSEHAQRSEVGQLSRSFQSNQPTLNPIRERSGRPDSTQDGRKTSRSQEIDVNSFCEEPSSSERTGRPVETNVNPTRSSKTEKISMLNRHVSERGDLLTLMT